MWFLVNIIQIILITIVCIVTMIPAIFFGLIRLPSISFKMGRYIWAPLLLGIVGGRVKVLNNGNLPKDQYFIIAANHQSHYDIVVLFRALSFPLYFIAKKELKKVPFLGWSIAVLDMIFIDRSNKIKAMESMKEAGRLIKNGKNVVAFPEGTRSKDGEIGMFRKGTFVIAQTGEINIVPIAIRGTINFHRSGKFGFRPGVAYVNIGKPISYKDYLDKTPEEFANGTQQIVKELYAEIEQYKS